MDLSWIIRSLRAEYYIYGIQFFIEIFTLIVGFIYARKTRIGRAFIFYVSFDFFVGLFDMFIESNYRNTNFSWIFLSKTNGVISIIQLLTYFYFFKNVINSTTMLGYMKYSKFFFILLILIFLITGYNLTPRIQFHTSFAIEAFEFIILIPPCFVFIHEMLNKESSFKLFERPSFWILTGILFFCILCIPFDILQGYFSLNKIPEYELIFACLYTFPFIINLLFLSKAFLCKKPLTI